MSSHIHNAKLISQARLAGLLSWKPSGLHLRADSTSGRSAPLMRLEMRAAVVGVVLLFQSFAAALPTDITLNSTSVMEHQTAGTIVGILKAVDAEPNGAHTFSLVPGAGADDNALFAISGDTLRTAAVFDFAIKDRFSIRLRTEDTGGGSFERRMQVTVTPPGVAAALQNYLDANPAVAAASVGLLDKESRDYFHVYLNALAATGVIAMDVPANTPPDTAATGSAYVYLSTTEAARIHAAKIAHAIWLDRNRLVPWRLADYAPEVLDGLFGKSRVFNAQAGTLFYFISVVDHSPSEAWEYARRHNLVRGTVTETIHAVLDDLRSDFLHGISGFGDPSCASRLGHALGYYSPLRSRPARIARSGCHSSSRILLGLLRSMNIPGYETTSGEYFLSGHSEAVFPCVGLAMPHGDDLYSASGTATPSAELLAPFQFFTDNATTPPANGSKHGIATRYSALQGTQYPTPTMLRGVANPASFGYSTAVEFLNGYAGWGRGLTSAELDAAANTLLTQFPESRRLTIPAADSKGTILNTPLALDYVKGSRVSLKAVPKGAGVFSHWTGDVPQGLETANPLVLSMDTDRSVQAVFEVRPVDLSIVRAPSGEMQLRFPVQAGAIYTVQCSDTLESGTWRTLGDVSAQTATGTATISAPATQPSRFYRVVTPGQ